MQQNCMCFEYTPHHRPQSHIPSLLQVFETTVAAILVDWNLNIKIGGYNPFRTVNILDLSKLIGVNQS